MYVIEPSTEETVADAVRNENSTDKQQLPSAEHGSSSGVSTVGHSSKGDVFLFVFYSFCIVISPDLRTGD